MKTGYLECPECGHFFKIHPKIQKEMEKQIKLIKDREGKKI